MEADSAQKIDAAVAQIKEMMKNGAEFVEKIPITGLPTDRLKPKLLGPRGQFLKHIESTANVRIQLRGLGSGVADSLYGMCWESSVSLSLSHAWLHS